MTFVHFSQKNKQTKMNNPHSSLPCYYINNYFHTALNAGAICINSILK